MVYSIDLKPSAARDLQTLPAKVQRQIARRIDALASNPRPAGARLLHGGQGLYRVRAGDYRILYQVQEKKLLVLVVKIGHRREVYKGL